jgi:hypothetical protein
LVLLLALHEKQHLAMFSRLIILASLTMCSHVGLDFLVSFVDTNSTPQYMQFLSLSMTSRSSQSGMFHLFITRHLATSLSKGEQRSQA